MPNVEVKLASSHLVGASVGESWLLNMHRQLAPCLDIDTRVCHGGMGLLTRKSAKVPRKCRLQRRIAIFSCYDHIWYNSNSIVSDDRNYM